jgi:hypothetical protein
MRTKKNRILEIATALAVLGIFVSLAVPSFMRMQARSRVDRLLEKTRFCPTELPNWVSNSTSSVPVDSTSERIGATVVLKNAEENDGVPQNDILAVHSVETGTK